MKYVGKLFGQIGRTRGYFDTGKTSGDWDALEARAERAEAELGKLQELHGCSQEMVLHWCEHAEARRRTRHRAGAVGFRHDSAHSRR
jgi:hypothetical protein